LDETFEQDYIDYPKLIELTYKEREERIIDLWTIAISKAKGAVLIQDTFQALNNKIKIFGRQMLVMRRDLHDPD
jgi:hypothetical protein